MKLICTQENFKKAIFNSERVVSRQTTLPILNNILFETEKGGLKLSATNLEIGVVTKIGAKIEKEGKIAIPAKLLSNFVNNLPAGENIKIEVMDQNIRIKSGAYKAVIKGFSATEFPLIPKKTSDFQFSLAGEKIKKTISKIIISTAINEARPELTGINLILKEKEIFFASTDSFRLSEQRLVLDEENIKKELFLILLTKKDNYIIPASTMAELSRIIHDNEESLVKISLEEGQIFFEVDSTVLVSRLINGKYPEYKHIIPKEFKSRVVGEKNLIQNAVKMASFFSSNKTNEIVLKMSQEEKKVFIEGRSVETGENVSEVNLDTKGPNQEIIFNARYLLDGITSVATSKVVILANSGATPVALKEINEKTGEILEDFIYIVMPIKN